MDTIARIRREFFVQGKTINIGARNDLYGTGFSESLQEELESRGATVAENVVYDNGFKEQWEMFIRHVCEDAPYKFTLLEGAKGVQLAECALQSWRERRWIDVAPIKV